MPRVLRQEKDQQNPVLPRVYGHNSTFGKVDYYTKLGNRTAFTLLLGEGYMDGVDEVRYNGGVLTPYDPLTGSGNYVFHPGALTKQISPKAFTADAGTNIFTANAHGYANDTKVKVYSNGTGYLLSVRDGLVLDISAWSINQADATPIAALIDISGQSNNPITGNPALFKKDGGDGKPALYFDGVNDYYTLTDFLASLTEAEVFIELKGDADPPASSANGGLWGFGSALDGQSTYLPYSDGVIYDGFGSTLRKATVNPADSLAAWSIYNVSTKAGEWTSRLNGTQIFTTASNVIGFLAKPTLGRNSASGYYKGHIRRIVIFDRVLTGPERAQVRADMLASSIGALPDPLEVNTTYYVLSSTTNTFQLSTDSSVDGGVAIDITTAGTGTLQVYEANAGYDDPVQGRPVLFPNFEDTYSGMCYLEIILSPEQSSGEDEPTKTEVKVRGLRVWNYDENGDHIGTEKIFSSNNALVYADLAEECGRMGIATRFDWPSWHLFRLRCDGQVPWAGGTTSTVPAAPTWVAAVEMTLGVEGSARKTPNTASWTAGAVTEQQITSGDGYIEFVAGLGTFACGLTNNASIIHSNGLALGIQCNAGNVCSINVGGVNYAQTAWSEGDKFRVAVVEGAWKVYHNDALLTIPGSPPAITYPLRGAVPCFSYLAGVRSAKFSPMTGGTAAARQLTRFNANIPFPESVDLNVGLEVVMRNAPGCTVQDTGGLLRWETTPNRAPVHNFVYDPTQTIKRGNIVKESFSTYTKSIEDKPNFLIIGYRDLDDSVYKEKTVPIDRAILRQQTGGQDNNPGVISVGVMQQSLAERIGESMMRFTSDLDKLVLLKGQRACHHVAIGDVVTISHIVGGWTEADGAPEFMILYETFEPGTKNGEERSFLAQIHSDDYYSDTAHGAITIGTINNLPSPLDPPPPVTDVDLAEVAIVNTDGMVVMMIQVAIQFDINFGYAQVGRLWLKRPDEISFSMQPGLIIPNITTLQGAIDISPVGLGTHEIKIVTQSPVGISLPFADHPTWSITIDAIPPPVIADVALVEGTRQLPDGRSIPIIEGVATFTPFVNQRARVWWEPIGLALPPPVTDDFLLLESDFALLLEDGSKIILDA